MKIELKLTNHKNTIFKQVIKCIEEGIESVYACFFQSKAKLVDELIDLAKTVLKLAKKISEKNDMDFQKAVELNNRKNEVRGYHD